MRLWLMAIILCLIPFAGIQAQQNDVAYVRDMLYVVLRETPDEGRVLRSGIASGTALEVLDSQGDYTRVRTPDGYTGWVSSQYLSDEPVARELLALAESELAALRNERDELVGNTAILSALAEATGQENPDIGALANEVQALRQQAAQARASEQERDRLMLANAALQEQLAGLQQEVGSLQQAGRKTDFLYGAGAVLLGVLIALVVPALKPKKRSEWA